MALSSQKRERSAGYLDFIRRQPCCVPGCNTRLPVEAHHPIAGRGGKVRASDLDCVPLCQAHHRGADSPHGMGNERKWCERHGIDLAAVQAALRRQWEALKGKRGKRLQAFAESEEG